MTTTDQEYAEAEARMLAAKRAADEATDTLEQARVELGVAILAARAAGMTVPQVADKLGYSQANVFRISAQAKDHAGQ